MNINKDKQKLIVVAGPTASGKTSYAIKLAQKQKSVLINADSMQIYTGMDIGTNKGILKPLTEQYQLTNKFINTYQMQHGELTAVGTMFDLVEPNQTFSVASYQQLTLELIEQLLQTGIQPILVGGTGLYISAILFDYDFAGVEADQDLRQDLSYLSVQELQERLQQEAPGVYEKLNNSDRNNPVRLIRKLELAQQGIVTSKQSSTTTSRFDYTFYYPIFDRNQLYQKIDRRVDEMFAEGLIREVSELVAAGFAKTKPMQSMGYQEIVRYLNSEIDLEQAKEKIKQEHRNYCSRQITWFEGEARAYNLTKVDFVKEST